MALRVGLRSTDILLTDVGKKWFLGNYPKGIIYEYDEYKPFSLMSMGVDFVEATCPLGIPYRFPIYVEGEITFQMADQEEPPVNEDPMKGRKRRSECLPESF